MFNNNLTTILILAIAIASTALLVGNRFDATWAGGSGYEAHATALADVKEYRRGQTISTGDEQWLFVRFGEADFWMYEDTQVKLIDGRKDQLKINVIQGRVIVEGPITIEVRELDLVIDGIASFVHYSWLNEIEVVSIEGEARLIREDRTEGISGQALKTTTLAPYVDETITFDPALSEAADFYQWALR
ncbi:hypothetical protein IH979_01020 [Patescibacteria group bacterium]|nr:hypothetical protein [Patescibacteria group bacterium]